ncbi:UNVERIFIED_CONTAM: hypothetical protein GTU68_064852 [Idotea baltica]|nr:hypothetical protein [Idotea baltica]
MSLWRQFSNWFWNPYVWLPKGFSWKDFVSNEKITYPQWIDLWTYPFFMAFLAIGIRFLILNKLLFRPIATYFGIKDIKARPVVPNSTLEELFRSHKIKAPNEAIIACAKKLDWSQRKVERWLRQRLLMNKVSKQTKFMECAWQFLYYSSMFTYGIYVMLQKPWLYDLNKCWYDYPYHNLDSDVWWYYMISLSFYWAMVFTHFFEAKRKDFWQMFFHHLVTISLITFSWTCNFTRVGTLILILHDTADIPLQAAKMCIYVGHKALCDAVFALFAVTWVLTRDCIYPFWIVRNTMFEATNIIPLFPAYYIFNTLLVILLILHFYWTYFIFRIIANTMVKGKMEDDRSSSDEEFILSESDSFEKENGVNKIKKECNGYNHNTQQNVSR